MSQEQRITAILREHNPNDSLAELLEGVIELFLENVERHGLEPERARAQAIADALESIEIKPEQLHD
jgi:hypothetical protein